MKSEKLTTITDEEKEKAFQEFLFKEGYKRKDGYEEPDWLIQQIRTAFFTGIELVEKHNS